jgi:fatty acid desaturase
MIPGSIAAERAQTEFRSSVADLYRRPLHRPLTHAATHLALYGVLAWCVARPTLRPYSLVLVPVLGLLLAGFLAAAHDCLHGTFVDGKAANRLAGVLWCTPLLVNLTVFQDSHLTHHRFTRVRGDSETLEPLLTVRDYVTRVFLHNPLRPALGALRIAVGWQQAPVGTARKQAAARADAIVVVAWLLLVTALTLFRPMALLAAYWGPLFFLWPMVGLTALPEHCGCADGPEILVSTRSVESNAFVRFALWNGNFHVEHHLHSGVPSCNLPELSRRMRHAQARRAPSYVRFHIQLLRELVSRPATPRQLCTPHPPSAPTNASVPR